MLNGLKAGATVITMPKFTPESYLDVIEKQKVLWRVNINNNCSNSFNIDCWLWLFSYDYLLWSYFDLQNFSYNLMCHALVKYTT